ncbi:MAG TPA: NAD-dependent protein deacetylase [Gammaproteobacteria bacterium]|nr:NAD-dependent protein deacetylase [Gammaproteobacteria bacterium]
MAQPALNATPADPIAELADLVRRSRSLVVLTGAGCSTESGIPDYRDENGAWKHKRPVQFQDFVASDAMRRRYWARSLVGWECIAGAQPNPAHQALAALEAAGHIHGLITQNVDGLHHKAGSRNVIDLHGRLDCVECLDCRAAIPRADFQAELDRLNPGWDALGAEIAPDGDALLENVDFDAFEVPVCRECGGILKPGVVFFGEAIPRERAANALGWLEEADALLVVGSSLMVWSGYRFARRAAERGIPIAAINLGRTRADDKITLRIADRCGTTLTALVACL